MVEHGLAFMPDTGIDEKFFCNIVSNEQDGDADYLFL